MDYSWLRSGHPGPAVSCYRRAAALLRTQSDDYQEAVVTDHLGDAYALTDRPAAARAAWLHAARLLSGLGRPEARNVQAKCP
jgi:predicted negative regulator of RcsB-dependent stress response